MNRYLKKSIDTIYDMNLDDNCKIYILSELFAQFILTGKSKLSEEEIKLMIEEYKNGNK